MKTIGIIGGMGPEATADLYTKIIRLTPATKDQEHLHVIIDSYAQIPDRTACIRGAGEDPAPFLIRSAKLLEQAGADALCMPCNTAHYFLDRVQKEVGIPFISIVDSTIAELDKMSPRPQKVAVMATTGTKQAAVYETKLKAAGYEVQELTETEQADLMSCIYDGVKKGETERFIPLFKKTLESIAEKKPAAILAACTELPLLMAHVQTDLPVVDPTLALAKACTAFGLER